MAKWNYVEEEGKTLRKLIDGNNHVEILKLIHKIAEKYSKITFDEEEFCNGFGELAMLIDGEWLYKDEELADYNWASWDELIDSRLYDLYNACDSYRVFLSL